MSPDAVFVHIGLPKTGTTHLQNVLWHNRAQLARQGVLYPGSRQRAHWAAAMEMHGSRLPEVSGAWQALLDEVRAYPGRVVISHEMFAGLGPQRVRAVVRALAPRDVHVVVTLRDLSRVVPATWQERAKNRQVESWPDFLEQVSKGPDGGHSFWRLQDAPRILTRWSRDVSGQHLHVVTVPPAGGDRDLLLRRLAAAVGFDADALQAPPEKANESIGAVEVALLQHINRVSEERLDWDAYRSMVKHFVVPKVLAVRDGGLRVVLPESSRDWVEEEARRVVKSVTSLGCEVIGDLGDLTPSAVGDGDNGSYTSRPEDVSEESVLEASAELVAALLHEVRGLRQVLVAAGPPSLLTRARRGVLARSETSPALRRALGVWRRIRRRDTPRG